MNTKQEIIEQLRERIGAIEWLRHDEVKSYALGIPEIDRALKNGGICAGSCHEIMGTHEGPTLGFTLALLSSMVKNGPILWCAEQQDFYTPGFISYGIKDTDVIFVTTANQQQTLWAMEQGLSCNKISATVITTKYLSLAQGRRLKLLAQKHNTVGIFITKPGARMELPTIATTRWHISHEPSSGCLSRNGIRGIGSPRLCVKLIRNVGGFAPLTWMVEFDEQTLRFYTVPQLLPSTTNHQTEKSPIVSARKRVA